jgi:hypothetical protein
MVSGL